MDIKTRIWLAKLPWWLYLVVRELPESGNAYVYKMLMPYLGGCMSLFVPGLLLLIIPELRGLWYVVISAGVILYLLVGIITYFACSDRSYGPWQEYGTW